MDVVSTLGFIMGTSFAAGIRLYGTIFGLGLAQQFGYVELPGSLDVLASPLVIAIAGGLYVLEFLGDKIPVIDSALDSIQLFVKPIASGVLGFMATSDAGAGFEVAAALLSGGVALTTESVKASSRVAINTSPEPFSNFTASTAEDGVTFGALWLVLTHPVVAIVVVLVFLVFAVWFIRKMTKYIKRVFRFFSEDSEQDEEQSAGRTGSDNA